MLTATLCLILISVSSAQDLADFVWFNESQTTSQAHARNSKFDWTGEDANSECTGNVITLNPGEATRVVSHKSYGEKSYPDNYKVS